MSKQKNKTTQIPLAVPGNPIAINPGYSYKFVFNRPTHVVEVVEAEDALFRNNSVVFLPTAIPEETEEDKQYTQNGPNGGNVLYKQKRVSGLAVMSGLFRFLQRCIKQRNPKRILITGHTDSVGSDESNQTLSKQRAEVIWALLLGGPYYRSILFKHVNEKHANEDIQHILKWIAYPPLRSLTGGSALVWNDVDPGEIDGKLGQNSQSAIRSFKKRMRSDFELDNRYKEVNFSSDFDGIRSTLVNNPNFKANAWAAVFEIYQAELQIALKEEGIDLSYIRGHLDGNNEDKSSTPSADLWPLDAVGCGETWPIEARGKDNYRSQTNRRVEILFYDHKEFQQKLPCKDSACVEKDCHVFKNLDRYEEEKKELKPKLAWEYIKLDDKGRNTGLLRVFVCDYDQEPFREKRFVIRYEGGKEDKGKTTMDGFILADCPAINTKGTLEVFPEDQTEEESVVWDIEIGEIPDAGDPMGASIRLANLGYLSMGPTSEMTDDLKELIECFQSTCEDLEVSGELNDETCRMLSQEHDENV